MPLKTADRRPVNGASLIELTITVFVIGILCISAFPYFFGERDEARKKVTQAKAAQIKEAIKQYQVENGRFPSALSDLKGQYLREYPPLTGWKKEFRLIYDPNPKLLYSTWTGDIEKKYVDEVLDPWKPDLVGKDADFAALFASRPGSSKILVGKKWCQGRVDTVPTEGVDALGRPVYNQNQGEIIYDTTLEIRLLTPDDPETTVNDPGYDIAFRTTGGAIVSYKKNNGPAEVYDPSEGRTEFVFEGTEEVSVLELGIVGCPFLAQFSMEVFRPGIPGTKLYYGAREVLSIPQKAVESYIDPDTGYEVRVREQLPIRLERYFHEAPVVGKH